MCIRDRPPQSIEEIKAGLETTEKGGVRQSIRNCLTVFQRDPLLSGAIAYNILTDRKDIIKPIGFHRESTALNDTDMKYLLLYLEETYGLTNEKKIDNAIGIAVSYTHLDVYKRQAMCCISSGIRTKTANRTATSAAATRSAPATVRRTLSAPIC